MTAPSRETADLGRCLVTGAAGYLGRHLVAELARRGLSVRALDVAERSDWPREVEFVRGDVRRPEELRAAFQGIDTVFHTAAVLVFLTYATRAERERAHAVNVDGVRNVTRACTEAGVKRLVHTSSNNVTLDGPVIDGDETTPYARHARDLYTVTKVQGEKIALEANGKDGLLTCALRPGGIYGPGEMLMFPRLVDQLRRRLFIATIGDPAAKSDNTYIDNLVDGQITAAQHLVEGSPACGQAYFITDGAPINYFEFFRPFVQALGFTFPKRRIPAWPLYAAAWVGEVLHRALRTPPPPLTCLEVRKVTVSHYSRIDKARRDLGWEPPVSPAEAVERCLPWCRELLDGTADA